MSGSRTGALVCAGLAAAAALACPAPHAVAADGVTGTLTRLQSLYRRAEQATESYDATKEKLDSAQSAYAALAKRLTGQHGDVAAARDTVGALARQQYRGGGISPYARLLLADDPTGALTQAHVLGRAAVQQAALVARLRGDEHTLTTTAARAGRQLAAVRALAAKQVRTRDRVRGDLDEVEREVAALTGGQLSRLTALEQRDTGQAQSALPARDALGGDGGRPSSTGRRAVAYAFAQLGKPYGWGTAGPRSFDCSGLTSQAWDHAGRPIPRTSQGQWRGLPRVALNRVRPGDLIVYYPGATHVALYIGGGRVVQAPRPGAVVRVSPIAADPVLGAVRPDAGARAVKVFKPPALPAAAREQAAAALPLGGRTT